MNRSSFDKTNVTRHSHTNSNQPGESSIQIFQHWIENLDVHSAHSSGRAHERIARRTSFTNGPYAEIKEVLGTVIPVRKLQEN